jgi:hypothetical protein
LRLESGSLARVQPRWRAAFTFGLSLFEESLHPHARDGRVRDMATSAILPVCFKVRLKFHFSKFRRYALRLWVVVQPLGRLWRGRSDRNGSAKSAC